MVCTYSGQIFLSYRCLRSALDYQWKLEILRYLCLGRQSVVGALECTPAASLRGRDSTHDRKSSKSLLVTGSKADEGGAAVAIIVEFVRRGAVHLCDARVSRDLELEHFAIVVL